MSRRTLVLVLSNLLGVVGVWLLLLFVSAGVEDVFLFAKHSRPPKTSKRVALPNYPDKEQARQMFLDFKLLDEDYVPYVVWRRTPLETENVNIGPDGSRIHRRGPENDAPNARTIGFYGGSTMFGKGARDDDTIPALFDQLTRDYAVTNFGQSGYHSRQMLALLVNQISTGEMPEIVVFYDGYNFVWTHCNYAVTRLLNGHMQETRLRAALTHERWWGYTGEELVLPLLERSRRLLGRDGPAPDEWACAADAARAEAVAATLVRIWQMAAVLVEANGGRFEAFLHPVAYIGSPRFDHLDYKYPGAAEEMRTVYPIIQQKLAGRAWFTDLTASFDGDEYLYIDDVHVSRRGNEIVARRVRERLASR